jgi:ribosomal protein S18 acetylase RimI-like enzyme
MVVLREARLPEDAEQIASIDTSFTTDMIYVPRFDGDMILLKQVTLDVPITKRFPIDDLIQRDTPWEFAIVATINDRICGFIAADYQVWNRRVTIRHLYVDGHQRKRGIGRALTDRAEDYGIEKGALSMWAETSSLNTPGVRAYRRLGFELCGLDTTLYQGTPAENETALFLARLVPR